VRQYGKNYAHPLIVLLVFPNDLEWTRFGITAGKSVGNAVQRNRSKRLLRAGINSLFDNISNGYDVVLIARQALLEANFQQIEGALSGLLGQAGLLECE
jgi:ribonuclease P protein component